MIGSQIKYACKKIKEGTLEDWKRELFEKIAGMKYIEEHIGSRRKRDSQISNY